MNVIQILSDSLKLMGADGLCTDEDTEGCGCGIDDIAPCGEWIGQCVPAKKIKSGADDYERYGQVSGYMYVPIDTDQTKEQNQ